MPLSAFENLFSFMNQFTSPAPLHCSGRVAPWLKAVPGAAVFASTHFSGHAVRLRQLCIMCGQLPEDCSTSSFRGYLAIKSRTSSKIPFLHVAQNFPCIGCKCLCFFSSLPPPLKWEWAIFIWTLGFLAVVLKKKSLHCLKSWLCKQVGHRTGSQRIQLSPQPCF